MIDILRGTLDRLLPSDRSREIAFGAALLAAVPLIAVAGEAALRAQAAVRGPGTSVLWESFTQPLSGGTVMRQELRPGARAGHVRINGLGLRGSEISPDKPPRTIRIAFLGDSRLLNASAPEENTIVGMTLDGLVKRYPKCRFEPLWAAGPRYTLDYTEQLLNEQLKALEPDAVVLMLGSIADVLAEVDESHEGRDQLREAELHPTRSWLWNRLTTATHLAREERRLARANAPRPDLNFIGHAWRNRLEAFASSVSDLPVVTIGYRGRLRSGSKVNDMQRLSRKARAMTFGFNAHDVAAFQDRVVAETALVAKEQQWAFIDPIADVPPDATHFRDHSHLTPPGSRIVADALTEAMPEFACEG